MDFWAIEVKNTNRIRSEDLKGLKAFLTDYPESRQIVIYRGKDFLSIDGITCIPADYFLRYLHPAVPLSTLLSRYQGILNFVGIHPDQYCGFGVFRWEAQVIDIVLDKNCRSKHQVVLVR